jgi:hypothetical protein
MVSSQWLHKVAENICDWDTENAYYLPVPLHDENIGVLCGIDARRIIFPMFFMTLSSDFEQDDAPAHITGCFR